MIALTPEEREMRDAIIAKMKVRGGRMLPSEMAEEIGATAEQMRRILQSLLDSGVAGPQN